MLIQDATHGKGKTMEVAIRKMGNSQGVLIPKPILTQVGLEGTADLQVRAAWPSRATTPCSA